MNSKLMILDGSMGSLLEEQGENVSGILWSSQVLVDNPAIIKQIHVDYCKNGADIITTCSFQANVDAFLRKGFTRAEAEGFMQKSVILANEARDLYLKSISPPSRTRIQIAVSLGCYGAFLSDGSEYTGDYKNINIDDLLEFHLEKLCVFQRENFDKILFETIPSFIELQAIIRMITKLGNLKSVWISCCFKDQFKLCDGTSLEKVLELINCNSDYIEAFGFNCCSPEFALNLTKSIRKSLDKSKLLICYPNSGEEWDSENGSWVPNSRYDGFVNSMVECANAGANIVGGKFIFIGFIFFVLTQNPFSDTGCCRIGLQEILLLRRQFHRESSAD